MKKPFIIKYTWEEFHGALRGYDIFIGSEKQMKWDVFCAENSLEIMRILSQDSSKYTIIKRQEWHDEFGGLAEGVIN